MWFGCQEKYLVGAKFFDYINMLCFLTHWKWRFILFEGCYYW